MATESILHAVCVCINRIGTGFFSNERVSEEEILRGHFDATRHRLAAGDGPTVASAPGRSGSRPAGSGAQAPAHRPLAGAAAAPLLPVCCSASPFDPRNRSESTCYHADRRPICGLNNIRGGPDTQKFEWLEELCVLLSFHLRVAPARSRE